MARSRPIARTVLTAFQQVEDELSSSRCLEQQEQVSALRRLGAQAERLALNQYRAGTVPTRPW